jgi:hypothetical protein
MKGRIGKKKMGISCDHQVSTRQSSRFGKCYISSIADTRKFIRLCCLYFFNSFQNKLMKIFQSNDQTCNLIDPVLTQISKSKQRKGKIKNIN